MAPENDDLYDVLESLPPTVQAQYRSFLTR
jgi:hypothetical protein